VAHDGGAGHVVQSEPVQDGRGGVAGGVGYVLVAAMGAEWHGDFHDLPSRADQPGMTPVAFDVGEQLVGEFNHASDLVSYIRSVKPDFKVFGACYPEGHYQADSLDQDIENLKIKVDAGVTHLILIVALIRVRAFDVVTNPSQSALGF